MSTFTKKQAVDAYTLLSVRYHRDQKWIAALMRGWENLAFRKWQWDGITLSIQSTSDPEKRYSVTEYGCHCYAAQMMNICDHLASWWVCHEASRLHARAQRRTKPLDINAAVDELF